jgi:hypothetical protein
VLDPTHNQTLNLRVYVFADDPGQGIRLKFVLGQEIQCIDNIGLLGLRPLRAKTDNQDSALVIGECGYILRELVAMVRVSQVDLAVLFRLEPIVFGQTDKLV